MDRIRPPFRYLHARIGESVSAYLFHVLFLYYGSDDVPGRFSALVLAYVRLSRSRATVMFELWLLMTLPIHTWIVVSRGFGLIDGASNILWALMSIHHGHGTGTT